MQVRQRHLGRRHEPVVLFGVVVEVVAELRQLAGVPHRLFLHHRRQVHLRVAVLVDVQLQHEGDQRPLQPRARALQHVEAAAGQLHAALEVDDAQRLAQLPVRLAPRVACTPRRAAARRRSRPRSRRTASPGRGCSGSPSAARRARSSTSRSCGVSSSMRVDTPFISSIIRWRSAGSFAAPIFLPAAFCSARSGSVSDEQRRGAARPARGSRRAAPRRLAVGERLAHDVRRARG